MRGSLIVRSFLAALAVLLACAGTADAGPKDHFKGRHVGGGGVAAWCSDASIVSPVQGTSLAAQCALTAEGATGPRFAFDAAHTWVDAATSLGAGTYLGDLGCVNSFYNSTTIWCPVTPGGSILIEKYDFGPAAIGFAGDNITVTLRDTRHTGGSIAANQDRNGGALTSEHVVFNLEHTEFNGGPRDGVIALFSAGSLNQSYSRIKNQVQVIWFMTTNTGSGPTERQDFILDHNYITGGGVDTACCTHLETLQYFGKPGAGNICSITNNVINPIDGQPGAGANWTAFWVMNKCATTMTSNIFHNWNVVNANTTWPGTLGPMISYDFTATFTNNAFGAGSTGEPPYGVICGGCPTPTDGGGNRNTEANTAINF